MYYSFWRKSSNNDRKPNKNQQQLLSFLNGAVIQAIESSAKTFDVIIAIVEWQKQFLNVSSVYLLC